MAAKSKGRLFLIPLPLSLDFQDGIRDQYALPEYNHQVVAGLQYFAVERIRTARRFIRTYIPELVIDDLTFLELSKHTKQEELQSILLPALQGHDMGILSEAGVPGVADPGARLVALAHQHDMEVIPLVGPSSIIMAVMSSGMNGQSFTFHGYLPAKKEALGLFLKKLESIARQTQTTQLFIEAPHRNQQIINQAIVHLSENTRFGIACDLTMPTQYIKTKTIRQWKKTPPSDLHKRPAVFLIDG